MNGLRSHGCQRRRVQQAQLRIMRACRQALLCIRRGAPCTMSARLQSHQFTCAYARLNSPFAELCTVCLQHQECRMLAAVCCMCSGWKSAAKYNSSWRSLHFLTSKDPEVMRTHRALVWVWNVWRSGSCVRSRLTNSARATAAHGTLCVVFRLALIYDIEQRKQV
jgi:hypothetical protein